MHRNTEDRTLERNYVQKWKFLIREYELTKEKKHPRYRFVSDFYKANKTNRQTFLKYYNRYQHNHDDRSLLPRKRGPKWKSRRPLPFIEQQVLKERRKGINRYEIWHILKPKLKSHTPSPSGIYNICRRHQLNRLSKPMKQSRQQIIKQHPGDLAHVDCHYLSKDMIVNDPTRYYLVGLIDDCSRVVWVEVVKDIKALTVMFSTLKIINLMSVEYGIQFKELLSDNGSEFASRKNVDNHPFERMLKELGIKHRYIKPYRPQTNGKIERFWRTLDEDLIEGTTFDSLEHFKDELEQYLLYYNQLRPHQGLNGDIPHKFLQKLSTN